MSAAAKAASDPKVEAKGGRKGKLFLLAVPLVLALAGAGAYMAGLLDPILGHKSNVHALQQEEAARHEPPTFIDIPDLIANLNGGQRRPSFVKLRAKLELARAADAAAAQTSMPKVVDLLQTYLREMRPEELRGSAGTYRLREELLGRISAALAPVRILDVLFVELLVQ